MKRKFLSTLAGVISLAILTVAMAAAIGLLQQARSQNPTAAPTPSPQASATTPVTNTASIAKPAPTPPEPTPAPGTPGPRVTTPTPTMIPVTPAPPLKATSPMIIVPIAEADFGRVATGAQIVVSASWGDGNAQFGKGASRTGPTSFTIDDQGKIYVLDTLNARVQQFAPDGKYLTSFQTPKGVEDIVFDGGFLYLLDSYGAHLVKKLDSAMRLVQDFPIAQELSLVPSAGGLFVHGGNIYVASLGDQSFPRLLYYQVASSAGAIPVSEQPKRRVPGRPAVLGDGYIAVTPGDSRNAIIRSHGPSGETTSEFGVSFETSASAGFGKNLDQDRLGDVYLGVSFLLPGPERFDSGVNLNYLRLVVQLSAQGQFKRAFPITGADSITDVQKDMVIRPDGGIYQLKTLKEGVQVLRWR